MLNGDFTVIPGVLTAETLQFLDEHRDVGNVMSMFAPGYDSLADVLQRAFNQAAKGKGAKRHAQGQPFDEQPMQTLCDLYGVGFALGQAAKKLQEAQRLPHDAAIRELLGAINYAAGAVIFMERTANG